MARFRHTAAPWRFNNERNHLSGMLLFTGVHFLAVLEGQERDLDGLSAFAGGQTASRPDSGRRHRLRKTLVSTLDSLVHN